MGELHVPRSRRVEIASPRDVYPFEVLLPAGASGLERESKAQPEQVRSVSVGRVGPTVGMLPAELSALDEALRLHLAL